MGLLKRNKGKDRADASPNGDTAAPQATATATAEPPAAQPAKVKPPKPPQARAERSRSTGSSSLFDLSDRHPSREEMEREAAAELEAAVAPSWSRLREEVPDASSPAEAEQRIESQLGPLLPDQDAGIPAHPIYRGDALVYQQLRRHYGAPHAGGSFRRSWYPLSGG